MLAALDRLLDRITMYRCLLYYLLVLEATAILLSFFDVLPYGGWFTAGSAAMLVLLTWGTNQVAARIFRTPAHNLSAYITGLILALIITPIRSAADVPFYIVAPVVAMLAKHAVAVAKQQIFNPAALAVVLTAFTMQAAASWWVGNAAMLPLVALGGYLLIRKIRRWDVVLAFSAATAVSISLVTLWQQLPLLTTWKVLALNSPLFFFALVMLPEPWTMPPTHRWRVAYGALIGLLFTPQLHVGSFYVTPELALLAGNLVFFLIKPRRRYTLTFVGSHQLSPTTSEFTFSPRPAIRYQPGQYLEWTIPHHTADQRGLRRFFTIASSPTEDTIRLGVKFYEHPSTFKTVLRRLQPGQKLLAGQLDGDFTLPADPNRKLAFIAGGIGVTPFRSMIKYLLDQRQRRDMVLLYASQEVTEFAYGELLTQAETDIGLRTVFIIGNEQRLPAGWPGEHGRITAEMIQRRVPDYAGRTFYLSGPQAMVENYKHLLRGMGLPAWQVKTDYFPGFA